MAGMQQLTLVAASCETLELVVAGEGRGGGILKSLRYLDFVSSKQPLRPSKQPLRVRTFLKVYMELGS